MVSVDSTPPISTDRWYEAPPPGARGRVSSSHVPTADRVRSHVRGVALETVNQIEAHLITRSYEGLTGPRMTRLSGRRPA